MSTNNFQSVLKNHWLQIAIIGLALFAVIALCLGMFGIYIWIDTTRPTSAFTVDHKIMKKIPNNQAISTFYLSKVGKDLNVLNRELDPKATAILDYLKNQAISEDDIEVNKNSYPEYRYITNPKETPIQETRLEISFTVTFNDFDKDLTKPTTILNKLISLGVSRFDPFRYQNKDLSQLCLELENQAFSEAKNKVEDRLSAVGGSKIIKLNQEVVSGCDRDGNVYPMKADVAVSPREAVDSNAFKTAPPLLNSDQEINVVVRLNVDYR